MGITECIDKPEKAWYCDVMLVVLQLAWLFNGYIGYRLRSGTERQCA